MIDIREYWWILFFTWRCAHAFMNESRRSGTRTAQINPNDASRVEDEARVDVYPRGPYSDQHEDFSIVDARAGALLRAVSGTGPRPEAFASYSFALASPASLVTSEDASPASGAASDASGEASPPASTLAPSASEPLSLTAGASHEQACPLGAQ